MKEMQLEKSAITSGIFLVLEMR